MLDESHCCMCSSASDAENMLLCDQCDRGYHIQCLKPPLDKIPEGGWLCDICIHNPSLKGAGLVPLQNTGSSCYINCVLQCLATYDNFKQMIAGMPTDENQFVLTFQSLLAYIDRGKTVDLHMLLLFKDSSGNQLDPKYLLNEHQDLNEYLTYTLDYISEYDKPNEEEIKLGVTKANGNNIYNNNTGSKRLDEKTVIEKMFDGMLLRRRTCPLGHISTTQEMFRTLTLPFPQSNVITSMM
jgi:ubiquitin C-terminal hydrolase